MFKKILISTLLMMGLFTGTAFAIDLDFDGYIADKANLLSEESRNNLNHTVHDLNKKTQAGIAVVVLSTLKGQNIEKLASDILGEYKIGDDTKKNGVVFLIAIGERQLQVIIGEGLVSEINPKQIENIIDKNVLPYFEAGEYENGILRGTYLMADAIGAVEKQEIKHFGTIPDLKQKEVNNKKNWLWFLLIPLVIVIGGIAVFCYKKAGKEKQS